jgi:stage III sporulation protein SpoIIIAA
MDGLTQESYIYKQKLQNCEPIDLSRFVIDLRRDTWGTGNIILKRIRENTTANTLLITNDGVLLQKGLWSLIRLTSDVGVLPKYMFLNLPRDVICSTAGFRLRVHTLRFETATWN